MLQLTFAVWCSVLQFTIAVWCSVLQFAFAVWCSVLQFTFAPALLYHAQQIAYDKNKMKETERERET